MKFNFIIKSFSHYFRANLLVALGVLISIMVLVGALIIGDSVRHSLTQATFYRLGKTTHLVAATDRYFRAEMAPEMEALQPEMKVSPILLLEGMAVADGGQQRANKVQVIGVESDFEAVAGSTIFSELQGSEVLISENLAARLKKQAGDFILVRIKKASLIPMNAPFVSAEETTVALRAKIKKVIGKAELGRFNLKNSQTAPYNIFVSAKRLNRLMEFEGKANRLLIVSEKKNDAIITLVDEVLTTKDAGLQLKEINTASELEVSTERVFLEEKVAKSLLAIPEAKPIITYFVNSIEKPATSNQQPATIPYSFVSTVENSKLSENEIVLNAWAAEDLNAKSGDRILLKYFEIGPLRKLIEREASFVVRSIVPMDEKWADASLTPNLPGLSDAGHCREWEAGVPIDLDAIREKDEQYWNNYKGAPKAFVNITTAQKLWANRFGTYTAIRFPEAAFSDAEFQSNFSKNISPSDLGIRVEAIREEGVQAAQNGTDFSGLFIGLSFFILVAAIILTVLLFRFNLENRAQQIGLLAALGFHEKQVRRFFLAEGALVALLGGLVGLPVAILYTKLVFRILNSLWFDIVRTQVLEVQILTETLALGFAISFMVSMLAIFFTVKRFQKQKAADLQKRVEQRSQKKEALYGWVMKLAAVSVVGLGCWQAFSTELNPGIFFLSGALLLLVLLLLFRWFLFRQRNAHQQFSTRQLAIINLSRNPARSLTVAALFALGTFLVVSTGSNKQDLLSGAEAKNSGTGGFLWFAETTVPVLFDINNEQKRAEEGIYEDFKVVHLRRIDGDDASCLNLNRIAQPAILGVNPDAMQERFSFATRLRSLPKNDLWSALNEDFEDGSIPAIADQTVIQWGLGKKVGDVLLYQNELGDTLRLRLVAGTSPSIFQGYILISNKNFLVNYPSSSGSNVFLIDGKAEDKQVIGEELQSVFRDSGWEMQSAAERLVEFYSVTNTYLSIFLALGALGLILGTVGLTVILARTILERRRELAMMKAVGFTESTMAKMLIREYVILLFVGVIIGFIAAVFATLPAFLSTNSDASFETVVAVVALILVNGFVWIVGLSTLALRKKSLVTVLREE